MVFNLLLVIASGICLAGLVLRARHWLAGGVTAADRRLPAAARLGRVVAAAVKTLFGRNLAAVFRGIVLDGLLQVRLWRADRLRWFAHGLIFWGFMALLVLHAMDGIVTRAFFPGYEATLNPWLWLRNLFGLMVAAGLLLAVWRRVAGRSRLKTTAMDVATLVLVGAVVGSGFLVDAAKIVSRSDFHRMVAEYHDPYETEEVAALEALWVAEYGLAADPAAPAATAEQLDLGREVNDFACIACHSRPRSAVVSYALSRLLTPLGRNPERNATVVLTYWLHVLCCLGVLAWLPFGKLRHVVTSPLNAIADRHHYAAPDPALRATRRMLALDACTRCGLCSDTCSVGVSAGILSNRFILPAEKIAALDRPSPEASQDARALLEGLTVCTDCRRCTQVCPVGIDLQDLWNAVREEMWAGGAVDVFALSPLGIHRAEMFAEAFAATQRRLEAVRGEVYAGANAKAVYPAGGFGGHLGRAPDDGAFRLCFECKTCTSSCPIVGLADLADLDLAPHQIVHATALGLDDLVASARMLWACLGCYRCQDNCPQGVRVTDVLYLHKNKALARMKHHRVGEEV